MAKDKFEEQAGEKMESMLLVLPEMETDYLRCDPMQHKAGDTYLEVTKLLQVSYCRIFFSLTSPFLYFEFELICIFVYILSENKIIDLY